MNKKNFWIVLLPLAVAVAILFLPKAKNLSLRNALAEKSLCLSRWMAKKPQKAAVASSTKPLQEWFKRQQLKEAQHEIAALQLSPFSTLASTTSCDYVVASVLFRNISSWNSSLWINMGSEDSALLCKNCPVLSGDSVVGVVDYVGKRASCVRLITDSSVTPSVRVARGAKERSHIVALQTLIKALEDDRLNCNTDQERETLLKSLPKLLQELLQDLPSQEPKLLAKGILQGHGDPLWQAKTNLLKGYGFNYDFQDQHGPARDLRTGAPLTTDETAQEAPHEPLVKVGDLLVTSGMDGIFPEGLKVATVTCIMPLTEGAYAYELYATPTAADILDLNYVTILAPEGFDESDIPSRLDRILDQLNEP